MNASERKERLELKRDLSGSRVKLILDKHLIIVRNHHNGLGENDSTDLVGYHRHRIGIEVDDVLMTSWFVSITIAVDAEVELLSAHHEAFIE